MRYHTCASRMAISDFQNFDFLISKFWKINNLSFNIHNFFIFIIIKKLSTRIRDIVPLIVHTKFQVDILITFWIIIKKLKKIHTFFSVKKRFSRISLELWHVAARGSQHCFLRANTYQIICLYTREVNADVIGDPRQGHSRSPRVFPNNSW